MNVKGSSWDQPSTATENFLFLRVCVKLNRRRGALTNPIINQNNNNNNKKTKKQLQNKIILYIIFIIFYNGTVSTNQISFAKLRATCKLNLSFSSKKTNLSDLKKKKKEKKTLTMKKRSRYDS